MSGKVVERTKVVIEDNKDVEFYIHPHIEKVVKAIKYFDTKYLTLVTHIEEMDDGTVMILTQGNVGKVKKK